MDALQRAIAAIQDKSNGGWAIEAAQAWAAIAQVEATRENTEQLKRIADALHTKSHFGDEISIAHIADIISTR